MSGRPKVLVADRIADAGISALQAQCDVEIADGWSSDDLIARIGAFDAIVVRSATKVTAQVIEAGELLRVVGRAGVGVDNVDLDAASRRGIVVVNAPMSNVLSVAEHCMGLMLGLARNVARGDASMRAGAWERSRLGGIELAGRTLVLLGMGRIGQLVAERARAFDMHVVGYDPYVPAERFGPLGVECMESLDEALGRADVLSLHMPLTPDTRDLIGARELALLPAGALVINTARGGLIELDALDAALEAGEIGGAAIDVFPVEPLPSSHSILTRERALLTPHLAASTREAQDRAGEQVAEQVVAALCGGVVTSAVNVASIGAEDLEALQPWVPVASRLTRLSAQLGGGAARALRLTALGEIAARDVRMLSTGALVGLMTGTTDEPVNVVNAHQIAQQRGIEVAATTDDVAHTYRSLVQVCVDCEDGCVEVVGTTIGARDRPWLTHVMGFSIDVELAPHMAFFQYQDVPGVIGRVGSAFGDAGVNIANMAVARRDGVALMAVSFDEQPPSDLVSRLDQELDLQLARVVHLA